MPADSQSTRAKVSRRSIVIGAAWATPAVILATAIPSTAASPKRAGSVAFFGTSAIQSDRVMTVTTQLTYVGDGPPLADYPVSALTVKVAVPSGRVRSGPGVVSSGAGWTYVGRATVSPNVVFTFSWTGPALSSTQATTQLVVTLPKTNTRTVLAATLTANGTTNAAPMAAVSTTVTAPSIPPKGVLTQALAYGGVSGMVLTLQNALQWAGPYSPEVGAPIMIQSVEFSLPTSRANGTWTQPAWSGAGWTLAAPARVGTSWVFRATTSQVVQNGATNATTLVAQFGLVSTAGGTATVVATAVTANSAITVTSTRAF